MISGLIHNWSSSIEFKSDLIHSQEEAVARIQYSARSFCEAWYKKHSDKVTVFDKSRGWNHNVLHLKQIFPKSKILLTVRDLRNVFASMEKQHRKVPLLDASPSAIHKTIYHKAEESFAPNGLIGSPLHGILDIIRRQLDVLFIKYELLAQHPDQIMKEIYTYLNEPFYQHDFINIKNTAEDVDALYNYKFPHRGSGKVTGGDTDEYRFLMNDEISNLIMSGFHPYNQYFGYTQSQA
jgi:sulfotransferase